MLLCYKSLWLLDFRNFIGPCYNRNTLYNVMGVKRHIMPVDLPQSVSISGAEINLTVRAVSTGVLCCNLAESKSVLKMCVSKHCHEVTRFLLWFGTSCISCVVQQRSRVKDLFSLVGYHDSCLADIRHVKSRASRLSRYKNGNLLYRGKEIFFDFFWHIWINLYRARTEAAGL